MRSKPRGFFVSERYRYDPEEERRKRDAAMAKHVEKVVQRILTVSAYRDPRAGWLDLQAECQLMTGSKHLNFSWFYNRWPSFPIKLAVGYEPFEKVTMNSLFRDPGRMSVVIKLEAFASDQGHDLRREQVAYVFNEVQTQMVIHNCYSSLASEGVQIRIRKQCGTSYFVEHFFRLLGRVGREWLVQNA